MHSFPAVLCLALLHLAAADWGWEEGQDLHSFQSRPDLKPPKFNVTYHNRSKVKPGFWFVAPYNFENNVEKDIKWHACEIGPAIYDTEGELVWSGACQFGNQNFQDFRISPHWDGGFALTGVADHSPLSGGTFAGVFMGSDYEVMDWVPTEEFHEFAVLEGGDRILESIGGSTVLQAETLENGKEQHATVAERTGFREFDPTTGSVLFEWQTLDHIDIDESYLTRPGGANDWWEPFHLNSIDKSDDGHYLVSLRHANVILLVDGDDGHIIWRAGGKKNDFALQDGLEWARQHDARFISRTAEKTVISLFDNAADEKPDEGDGIDAPPPSRGLIVELHHPASGVWTGTMIRQYERPDGGVSPKCGSLQRLPDDHVFICWSEGGYLSEHAADGAVLVEARWLRSNRFGTYRGFKFEDWVGAPATVPAARAVVLAGAPGSDVVVTTVYVSWNGATEVRAWEFAADGVSLGTVARTGFETSFVAPGAYASIVVKAIGADGRVLGQSDETPAEDLRVARDDTASGDEDAEDGEDGEDGDPIPPPPGSSRGLVQSTKALAAERHRIVAEHPRLASANMLLLAAVGLVFAVRMVRRCLGRSALRYRRAAHEEPSKLV